MTSTELARLCHVSRATVDRVFNQRGNVSEQTRNHVLAIAKSVNYRPNYFAKSLVTGKSMTIGLLLPAMENSFFYSLFRSVSRAAQQAGYAVLASLYDDRGEQEEEHLTRLVDRHVDGVLLFSTARQLSGAGLLSSRRIPAVALVNRIPGFPHVTVNFQQAMRHAVQYVFSKGYQRLFFVCPSLMHESTCNMDAILRRRQGFYDAVESLPAEELQWTVLDNAGYLERLQNTHFHEGQKTALLCSSDIIALKVLKSLRTQGVRVPEQAGVMGFDGIDALELLEPSLATVKLPLDRLGAVAVDLLLEQMEKGTPAESRTVPYEVMPGQSIV